MKKLLLIFLLSIGLAQAQTATSNLITPNGWTGQTYSGNNSGANPVSVLGCCTGSGAYLDTSATNGGITFSYSSRTVSQAIAINQALSGTGVQLSGYNYSWQYLNQGYNAGTLTGNINLKSNTGSTLGSWNYTMPTTTDWTTMSGTQNFSSVYSLADVSNLNVSFTGRDNRFWAGFYGPRVRNIDVSLNYTVDPCVGNPRYSSSCSGYNNSDMWSTNNLTSVYGTTFAINQALGFGNTGVRVHSVNWGYDYNIGGRYCSGWNFFGICFGWTDSEVNGTLNVYRSNGTSLITDSQTTSGENITGSFRREVLLGNTSPDISTLGNASINLSNTGNSSATPYIGFRFSPDICNTNPLTSPQCPGYAAALFTQQCNANALYDPSCPGYASAYLTQQCSINTLYSPSCPGYAAAYYTQQCSLNPLYDSGCSGYAAAYKTQQCNANPLYDSSCSGYAAAYKKQQCDANPLYDASCSGYAAAYKTQQCNLNGLYATDCPNYGEAYAKKNILGVGSTTTTTTTSTSTVSTTEPTVQVRSDGKVDSTSVPLVKDSNVNSVITSTTTSATPSATAAVPLVSTPTTSPQGVSSVNTQTNAQAPAARQEPTTSASPSSQRASTETKETKTDQQKMKDSATAKAKEEMKKAASAPTMEAQIATQSAVVGLMSFVPGFASYTNTTIIDYNQIKMQRQYEKDTVDNRRVLRMLNGASDRLHQEMVDRQYNLGSSND